MIPFHFRYIEFLGNLVFIEIFIVTSMNNANVVIIMTVGVTEDASKTKWKLEHFQGSILSIFNILIWTDLDLI